MSKNPTVKEWLENRPKNTRKTYGSALKKFCDFSNISPESFQKLDRKVARDLAWEYIKTLVDRPSVANVTLAAIKSFYRNHDGETLPFDNRRGGKHYFNNMRRKRAAYEHVPKKKEVYEIADMATNLRDRAIILVLFQSGIRVNALCRLTYGMIRSQLKEGKTLIRLRITDEVDTKLQGYSIRFYDTFVGQEAINALKKYCDLEHHDSDDDAPLFRVNGKQMAPTLVWANIKRCIVRAGFDKRSMTVHTLRKAFKRVVRSGDIDGDFKEAIMGHVLPGSRENYFSRMDYEEVERNYNRLDFSRRGKPVNYEELEKKVSALETERNDITARTWFSKLL